MAKLPRELVEALMSEVSRLGSVAEIAQTVGASPEKSGLTRRGFIKGSGQLLGKNREPLTGTDLGRELNWHAARREIELNPGSWDERQFGPIDEADPDDLIYQVFGDPGSEGPPLSANGYEREDLLDMIKYLEEIGLL